MFTSIDEAIAWITIAKNEKHSFEHFKAVMNKLDNPQNDFFMVHVTGTDGKGSTVTYLRDLLMSHGFKVGTLQSPHYVTHLDRIRINNVNIYEDDFLAILNKYYDFFVENNLSMFEMDYIIMCEYFKKYHIDIAIVEVGIGGRLDSTNVVDNTKLSIITTIGYDHMELLGDTLPKITYEKCGIIKDNSKVLIGHLDDECIDVVNQSCKMHNCELYKLNNIKDLGDRRFEVDGKTYQIGSYAKYQLHNSALALKAFEILSKIYPFVIDDNKVSESLLKTNWPNRFEIVKECPRVILDGGHNIHGIEALCESFDQFNGSKCIIFSALKRKEYNKMVNMLKQHCDKLVITSFDNSGVIDLDEFSDYQTNDNYLSAIDSAIKEYDNILICGSLYFLSDVVLNYKF